MRSGPRQEFAKLHQLLGRAASRGVEQPATRQPRARMQVLQAGKGRARRPRHQRGGRCVCVGLGLQCAVLSRQCVSVPFQPHPCPQGWDRASRGAVAVQAGAKGVKAGHGAGRLSTHANTSTTTDRNNVLPLRWGGDNAGKGTAGTRGAQSANGAGRPRQPSSSSLGGFGERGVLPL